MLVQSYNQKLEGEKNEDGADDEDDTSKLLDEIVRKRTVSTQSNGDIQANQAAEEKKEINGESEMNGVNKGKG